MPYHDPNNDFMLKVARFIIFLSFAMLLVLPLTANAESASTASTQIYCDVPASWEIQIPAYVDATNGMSMAQIAANYVHTAENQNVYVDIDSENCDYDPSTQFLTMKDMTGLHSINLYVSTMDGQIGEHVAVFSNSDTNTLYPVQLTFSPNIPEGAYAGHYTGILCFKIYTD